MDGQQQLADVFVMFGITGDLAKVMTFHSLSNSTRFTRQDGIEECWRIMAPLLEHPPAVHPYKKGSWGPPAGEHVLDGFGPWHEPWVAS